jgi:hypothetical protein
MAHEKMTRDGKTLPPDLLLVLDDLDMQAKHMRDASTREKGPRDYSCAQIKMTLRQYQIISDYIDGKPES